MLVRFFFELRSGGVPVTVREFLALLEALEARIAWLSAEDFYYLARIRIARELTGERMFPLTLEGLDRAMTALKRPLGPLSLLPPAAPSGRSAPAANGPSD